MGSALDAGDGMNVRDRGANRLGMQREMEMGKRSADENYSKRPGEYLDPCQEAASRSLKCLHRNGGDREMCTDYFQ